MGDSAECLDCGLTFESHDLVNLITKDGNLVCDSCGGTVVEYEE